MIDRRILPTERYALVEYFAGMRGPVQVAFEEGTQAQWLHDRSPGSQSRRGTRLTLGPLAEPEEASGRHCAESQIEPWFAL